MITLIIMLIKRLIPLQKTLTPIIQRSYRNYPYFHNQFSSPPPIPEYFLMYNNMFRKSKTIEMKNSLKETFRTDASADENFAEGSHYEFRATLEQLNIDPDIKVSLDKIETRATNRKTARAKKKRNKRRHGRAISLNMK